ncbi:MAG: hypothetical protein ACLQAT_03890 [Candidatus Binataceae bacterium]
MSGITIQYAARVKLADKVASFDPAWRSIAGPKKSAFRYLQSGIIQTDIVDDVSGWNWSNKGSSGNLASFKAVTTFPGADLDYRRVSLDDGRRGMRPVPFLQKQSYRDRYWHV